MSEVELAHLTYVDLFLSVSLAPRRYFPSFELIRQTVGTLAKWPECSATDASVLQVFLQTTSVWQHARRKIQERLRAVYIAGVMWIILAIAANVVNLFFRIKTKRINCTIDDMPIIVNLVLGEL